MTLLGRDAILAAQDLQQERLAIPEWGGEVIVQGLNADERDAYENSYLIQKGPHITIEREHMRAKLVALAVVDEEGRRVFSAEDVAAIGRKSAAAIDRIYEVAMRLSGLAPKDVEELLGN